MRIDFEELWMHTRGTMIDFHQFDLTGILRSGYRFFLQAFELNGGFVLSLSILSLLCTPVAACADDNVAGNSPQPKVSLLQDEYRGMKLAEERDETTFIESDYSAVGPVMVAGKWAVLLLKRYNEVLSSDWSIYGPEGKYYYRKIQIGLVAVDLETGKAFQLIVRNPEQAAPGFIWIDQIYQLPNNRCGVVIGWESPKPKTDDQFFLWEWDLNRNTVAPLGKGDFLGILRSCFTKGKISVEVLDPEEIREPGLRTYKMTDVGSHKSLSIPLSLSDSIEPAGSGHPGQCFNRPTLIPLASNETDSLILYHSYDSILDDHPPEVCLECLDPTAPDGRRWKWTSKAIRDLVGEDGYELLLLRRSSVDSTMVGLVASWESREFSTRVLLIDGLSGNLIKAIVLPEGYCNNHVLLSHDSKMLGVRNEIPNDRESEPDEVTYSLVDVESGLIVDPPAKIPDNVSSSQCFFLQGEKVFMSGGSAIRSLTLDRNPRVDTVFKLWKTY